jgi:hypothetical protein
MRISKKNLLKVISENQEMDEFAYRPLGTQDVSNKVSSSRPIWFPGNENDDMPDGWELNPTKTPGEEKYYMYLNGKAEEEWIAANQEFLDNLMEKTGKDFQIVDKTTTKYKPRNKQVGTSYVHSGINKPVKTKMKIEINRIVHQILATPEVNARLERLSIPDIRARETKHLNHYGEMSNDKIEYQTHTFNSYLSANQFLNFVVARIQKAPIEMEHKSYHLARQFNQIYNNWDETVKNQQSYQGKTDAYKLDKFGMDENNLDVSVRMDLSITGYLRRQYGEIREFEWQIKFQTKFGRKLQDSRWLGSLNPDKNETITKRVTLEPGIEFDDSRLTINNFEIRNALIEGLTELKDLFFKKFKPIDSLKLAEFKQTDVIKQQRIQ